MHSITASLFHERLKDAFPKLSEAELQTLDDSFHDASSEKTDEIETDLLTDFGAQIRRALVGRYRINRKLRDDTEYWNDFHRDFQAFSAHLPHEPAIIAAALALRPEEDWEWAMVEAWSWVYRHAALLDIDIEHFAEWCLDQDPESSRAFVEEALTAAVCVAAPPGIRPVALPTAANDRE